MKRQKLDGESIECDNILFQDQFSIKFLDTSKFENVTRVGAKSSGFDAEIVIDINTNVYKVNQKDVLVIAISNFLISNSLYKYNVNLSLVSKNIKNNGTGSYFSGYEYIMYGKIFKIVDSSFDKRTVFASFGGLLMSLTADKQVLSDIRLYERIYILIRKYYKY